MRNGNGTRTGRSAASRATHVPDDWQAEVLVCPDEHCHHTLVNAERVKGRPGCAGPIHKVTGHYPKMERLLVGIKERLS